MERNVSRPTSMIVANDKGVGAVILFMACSARVAFGRMLRDCLPPTSGARRATPALRPAALRRRSAIGLAALLLAAPLSA
jgi:hypothetical protein